MDSVFTDDDEVYTEESDATFGGDTDLEGSVASYVHSLDSLSEIPTTERQLDSIGPKPAALGATLRGTGSQTRKTPALSIVKQKTLSKMNNSSQLFELWQATDLVMITLRTWRRFLEPMLVVGIPIQQLAGQRTDPVSVAPIARNYSQILLWLLSSGKKSDLDEVVFFICFEEFLRKVLVTQFEPIFHAFIALEIQRFFRGSDDAFQFIQVVLPFICEEDREFLQSSGQESSDLVECLTGDGGVVDIQKYLRLTKVTQDKTLLRKTKTQLVDCESDGECSSSEDSSVPPNVERASTPEEDDTGLVARPRPYISGISTRSDKKAQSYMYGRSSLIQSVLPSTQAFTEAKTLYHIRQHSR